MPTSTQSLTKKRIKLKALASEAAKLAGAERMLADQQYSVAHKLELLADDLTDQIKAGEAEIKAIDVDSLVSPERIRVSGVADMT